MDEYACSSPRTLVYSRFMFLSSSFRRTGKVLNRFSDKTVVPFWAATTEILLSFPEISNSSFDPFGASSLVAVIIERIDRAHRELRASPRKPKVWTFSRSSYVDSFDV